jgi:hypothetical protein
MSHLSSQPTEIMPENPSQSTRSAGSAWAREKRFADVLGRWMAYIERSEGHPIVFLHGNPTSSFLWRSVLPYVEAPGRRLIAPDLIGMGDSDKVPAGAEPDRYRFASHARLDQAFEIPAISVAPNWNRILPLRFDFKDCLNASLNSSSGYACSTAAESDPSATRSPSFW